MQQVSEQDKRDSQNFCRGELKIGKIVSNGPSNGSKKTEILKIQSQIRRMKHLISMQVELRKNRQQLQKVNSSIQAFEQQLKRKKKQVIHQQLQIIEQRRLEREKNNKQSNSVLTKIKIQNKQRRKKMQSLINEYKQQYQNVYKKKLSQRREMMKLNIQDIKSHQSDYLKLVKKRGSLRVKTQNCQYSDRGNADFQPEKTLLVKQQTKTLKQLDTQRQKILDLVKKRKEYGELVQKQALKIKVAPDILSRVKEDKLKEENRKFVYLSKQKKRRKARLDTNFEGDIQHQKSIQLKKIATEHTPTKNKLTRLKNLGDSYLFKYQNGNDQALEKMCHVNLLRAKLLLSDF